MREIKVWNATLLYRTRLQLGEGAIWHPQWNKFLYVDIGGQKVGRIDPVTKVIEDLFLDKRVGTVVPAFNGKLVVALQGSIEELDFDTGDRKVLVQIEKEQPDNRCNDGKCDAAGRLWVGTMHKEAIREKGALYCFDGHSLKKKIGNRSVSNGICWSSDNKTMFYIDSFDHHIKGYDFELSTGELGNERIVVELENNTVLADGICIDEEGMLWVAVWGGAAVHRYDPFTGELIGKVSVDAPHVTSCAFGGEGMRQLFITTARAGLSPEQLLKYPLAGSLFIVNTDVKGVDANFYG